MAGTLVSVCAGGCRPVVAAEEATWAPVTYDNQFGRHWYDGKGEVSTYALLYPRYGEQRPGGTAVAVYVTEHFDPGAMVKAERTGEHTLPMVKLNLVQDFQTGIYDYNTMASIYVPVVDGAHLSRGRVAKVMYGSQDWCGQVYQQAVLRKSGLQHVRHSYFEGEGDGHKTLDQPANGFWEDGLMLWARSLAGPDIAPGERLEIPLLRSLETSRMKHIPMVWDRARMARNKSIETVDVPAGRFETRRALVEIERTPTPRTYSRGSVPNETKFRRWTFDVEVEAPHRIVRIARDDGLEANLVATRRLAYWDLQKRSGEAHLGSLGLSPMTSPRPPSP